MSEQHSKQPLDKAKLWEHIPLAFPRGMLPSGRMHSPERQQSACKVVQQAYLFRGISGKCIPILLMSTNGMN